LGKVRDFLSYLQLLFLVLIDFLEVLVGINLQFAASILIAGNNAVLVELKCTDSPCMVNAALNAVTQSACLVVTADEQENLFGVANSADTNGKSGFRYLFGVVSEETGVYDKGILSKSAYTCAGGKRGEGFVECDMSVNTASTQEQVDSAVRCDFILISLALSLKIGSHTVEYVHILCRNVDMVEEIVMHEVPVALVVLSGQTYIFVHIEGNNVLEGNLARLIHFDESLIYTQRRRTGGQTQYKGAVFLMVIDGIGYMLSSPCTHSVVIVFDNKFHFVTLRK